MWIPAFAGMTRAGAGMTGTIPPGSTREIVQQCNSVIVAARVIPAPVEVSPVLTLLPGSRTHDRN